MGYIIIPTVYNIEMYDWDSWFSGADDLICDTDYYLVYDENNNYLSTTDIYDDMGGGFKRTLVDGDISKYSEIKMEMKFSY